MIRALTLDLDDTLWAIAPVIEQAERALHDFLGLHCPQVCERYPIEAMRALRDRIAGEHPQLAHDFSAQRRMTLQIARLEAGADPATSSAPAPASASRSTTPMPKAGWCYAMR